MNWRSITKEFQALLYPLGFDLVKAFPVQRYNTSLPPTVSAHLPTFGRSKSTLAVVIGNTRHFWPIFINYLVSSKDICIDNHPVDTYSTRCIEKVVENIIGAKNIKYELRYTYDKDERFVAFQRLAHEAHLAYYNQILCLHQDYGPWIALRGVVIIDIDGPPLQDINDPPLTHPFPQGDEQLKSMLDDILKTYGTYGKGTHQGFSRQTHDYVKWVEMRDYAATFVGGKSCPYRYSQEQLDYHYTKDKTKLRNAIEAARSVMN
ncbi:uncharacterized protein VTP21DRAFT_3981 [Calcarisporiella thermophila]|uniref:uncharacterized protein n=1 Tax=Calcarisporiella thermophila TaxID=911321 RepID=UPI003744742D